MISEIQTIICRGDNDMNDWFTIEKVDSKTYVISEYKHWEESHSYLLLGNNKALLIDTGLGISNIKDIVNKITNLPIIVATTHIHWDHIGGHKYFNNIAVHILEKDWLLNFPIPLAVVKHNILKKPCNFPKTFDIDKYEIYKGKPTIILNDNDVIDIGNRKIKIIHTPGHSPGHICFYDMNNKYLFTGDLVYEGELDAYYPTTNPIDFKNSIDKIRKLDVDRILPAHHKLNIDKSLIEEIWKAFEELEQKGCLKQGNGIYKYERFSIHI